MARKTKMNNITSPELLAQVNQENKELLNDFIQYLKSTDKSEGTIFQYTADINIAFVWNLKYNGNIFFCDWTKRHLMRFQNWLLNENKNSPARIRRIKATLSSMSNFIESVLDDIYPNFRNIIHKIESPVNQPVREKSIFTEEQITELLKELVDCKKFDRACALSLALFSGRRKSELLRFRVSDFSDERLVCGGSLYKTSKIKTKGRGSSGKQLECFCLAKKFKPYLDLWLEERERLGIESEWLFPNQTDQKEQMQISTLNSWARSFSNKLNADFYWHSMRHLTVSNFVRSGIPESVIQQYFGWSDISMVSVYSDVSTDEQLSMYFTEDGIVTPEKKGLGDL